MQIEQWQVDRPLSYAKNARKIPARAVDAVARSIQAFGFRQPLVVDASGVLIAGHTRLLAARQLGLSTVPVHVATELTPAQVRQYRIMDNRSHEEASWDLDVLAEELAEMAKLDIDLGLTGLSDHELDGLLAAPANEDAVPDMPVAPVSELGDVWLLGPHRVICGDARGDNGIRDADCLWTDPPYGVEYEGKTDEKLSLAGDKEDGLRELLDGFLRASEKSCRPGAPFYLAHPPGALSVIFTDAVRASGWKIHQTLIWAKDSMVLGHSDYHYQHEPILYGYVPGGEGRPGRGKHVGSRWCGGNDQTSVLAYPRPKRSAEHPTMKPVELVRQCIENSCPRGGLVYDPFLGSGSTLIACEASGRRCAGVEVDPRYVDVVIQRWQAMAGKQAILEGTGCTYEHAKHGRRLGAEDAIKEECLTGV